MFGLREGHNLRIEVRWYAGDPDRMQKFAKELVDLRPEAIVVESTPATAALQRQTRTIPIIFNGLSDPVGAGFVASLPRPGGNITGFISIEGAMAGKWHGGPPGHRPQMCREHVRVVGASAANLLPQVVLDPTHVDLGLRDDPQVLTLCIVVDAGEVEGTKAFHVAILGHRLDRPLPLTEADEVSHLELRDPGL